MSLSTKHYRVIANIIKNCGNSNENQIENIKDDLSIYFKVDNPRFNVELFREACGEDKIEKFVEVLREVEV